MRSYKQLLRKIKNFGVWKDPARENMPRTKSIFGYQLRHDLTKGFPMLTTKKISWKCVVIELLWFLRGDTNISFLIEHGVHIWNEDAYNFYVKKCKEHNSEVKFTFESFIEHLKEEIAGKNYPFGWSGDSYKSGDCGFQYGRVWRAWDRKEITEDYDHMPVVTYKPIDQIKNVINSLRSNPEGRRHIVTAVDPTHDNELALYWCHALFQFNCRKLTEMERHELNGSMYDDWNGKSPDENNIPKYYLDCELYQRSGDVFLGVPFNIASYALLTHIIAKMCNMVAGEFIHSFGDVHIYENHMDAVDLQLLRIPMELPKLEFSDWFNEGITSGKAEKHFDSFIKHLEKKDFILKGYKPHPSIKAELSTGLIK